MIYSVGQVVPFVVVVLLAGTAVYLLESENQTAYIAYLVLAALVACGVILIRYYVRSRAIHYTITTQRIKLDRGWLSKVQESLELFRVDHFELRQPLGSRMLGQSFLHLYSSDAELENFSIYGIPNLASSRRSAARVPASRTYTAQGHDVCEGLTMRKRISFLFPDLWSPIPDL